jgi:hypothetical protein
VGSAMALLVGRAVFAERCRRIASPPLVLMAAA